MARDPRRIGRLARVRKVQEEQAHAAWQRALQGQREAEDELRELRRSMEESRAQLADPGGQHRPGWVAVNQQLEVHLTNRIRRSLRLVEQARLATEAAEGPWRQRRTQAKGLERLLDHAREVQSAEAEEIQNRELDEVALSRSRPSGRSQ